MSSRKVDLYTHDELDPMAEEGEELAARASGVVALQGPGGAGFWTPGHVLRTEEQHGMALVSWASYVAAHWGLPIEEAARPQLVMGAGERLETIERAILLRRLYHVPNGMRTFQSVAAKFKAQGLRASVPDYCLPVTRLRGGFHGLYIELKTPERYVGEAQRHELELLRAEGYAALGARGWWRAAAILRQYLHLPEETTAWQ